VVDLPFTILARIRHRYFFITITARRFGRAGSSRRGGPRENAAVDEDRRRAWNTHTIWR
jgi:hypothetical protein